jgi:hypothetical protein
VTRPNQISGYFIYVVIVTTICEMRCVPGHHLRYCKQTPDHAVLVEKTARPEKETLGEKTDYKLC